MKTKTVPIALIERAFRRERRKWNHPLYRSEFQQDYLQVLGDFKRDLFKLLKTAKQTKGDK